MKAVVYDNYGEPEVLQLREIPEPEIGTRECLVKVAAVSVNPSDWKTLAGKWRFATGNRFGCGYFRTAVTAGSQRVFG